MNQIFAFQVPKPRNLSAYSISKASGSISSLSCLDTFQQFFRRFVSGALGDESAGEGAGEEGWRERGNPPPGIGQPRFRLAGQCQQAFRSLHDFLLFGGHFRMLALPVHAYASLRQRNSIAMDLLVLRHWGAHLDSRGASYSELTKYCHRACLVCFQFAQVRRVPSGPPPFGRGSNQ